jgi:sodium transport system ATP-binding protein
LKLRNEGKTVIISTHILSVVEKICDRVGIIIDGEMKMTDTLEHIKKSDDYVDLETTFFNLLESGDRNE